MKLDNVIYIIYIILMRFFNIFLFSDFFLEFCVLKVNRIFYFIFVCGYLYIVFGFVECLLVNFLNDYCFELIISILWEFYFLN